MSIKDVLLSVLGCLFLLIVVIFGFNYLHCNPIKNVIDGILPKVAVAPVTAVIPPGSIVEYSKNEVVVKPPKSVPGTPQPPVKKYWHPVELKPWTDSKGILHIPQSGFCFCVLGGPIYNLSDNFYWEVATRIFVVGQLGFEPSGNDRGWSPKIGWRLFDSNIILDAGPSFDWLSFSIKDFSISAKIDFGLF